MTIFALADVFVTRIVLGPEMANLYMQEFVFTA
jgi:hypothetical protein